MRPPPAPPSAAAGAAAGTAPPAWAGVAQQAWRLPAGPVPAWLPVLLLLLLPVPVLRWARGLLQLQPPRAGRRWGRACGDPTAAGRATEGAEHKHARDGLHASKLAHAIMSKRRQPASHLGGCGRRLRGCRGGWLAAAAGQRRKLLLQRGKWEIDRNMCWGLVDTLSKGCPTARHGALSCRQAGTGEEALQLQPAPLTRRISSMLLGAGMAGSAAAAGAARGLAAPPPAAAAAVRLAAGGWAACCCRSPASPPDASSESLPRRRLRCCAAVVLEACREGVGKGTWDAEQESRLEAETAKAGVRS